MKLLLLLWWQKNSPCPTHHFFPKTDLPRHKPLHCFSFRGDNNQEFKVVCKTSLALWIARAHHVKEAAGVSAEHVHFRGTKYETRVDVGQCIRCRTLGESWIMLLESFRFEDEDEIYLEFFLASILKNYTPPESFIILLSRWYSRLPITRTLANSNLAPTRTKIDFNTNFKTEAHVSTPRSGQYLTYAHNHITRAVAAMDCCFALTGAHQHSRRVNGRAIPCLKEK